MTDICQRCISTEITGFVKFIHFAPYPSILLSPVGHIHQILFSSPLLSRPKPCFIPVFPSIFLLFPMDFRIYSGLSGFEFPILHSVLLYIYEIQLCRILLKHPGSACFPWDCCAKCYALAAASACMLLFLHIYSHIPHKKRLPETGRRDAGLS